jgi:hypothetical protein
LSTPNSPSASRRFKFQKRRQLFIRMHNETLPVVADARLQSRTFARWNQSLRHSPTPSGLAQIIGDDLPVSLHAEDFAFFLRSTQQ